MLSKNIREKLISQGRSITLSKSRDEALGALNLLPGTWSNVPNLVGKGWNMMSLPYVADDPAVNLNYRLLMNQYNETLQFTIIDKAVPNRGIQKDGDAFENSDQFLVALDYEQQMTQTAAEDNPVSGKAAEPNTVIHREPGLFILTTDMDQSPDDYPVARLASVPHGNSVLALGNVKVYPGPPNIPDPSGFPIGTGDDTTIPFLAPYNYFRFTPFMFQFDPLHPNALLIKANKTMDIVQTTEIHFDTKLGTGGIHNIPYIKRQADASEMSATFWIQELSEKDENGNPKLRIQYSQTVILEFLPRLDGIEGSIRWPHISINTLEKTSDSSS